MYAAIMTTIRTRHDSMRRAAAAEQVLKWILFAARPLTPVELLEVIADGISLSIVFDICQNLVVLDAGLGVRISRCRSSCCGTSTSRTATRVLLRRVWAY